MFCSRTTVVEHKDHFYSVSYDMKSQLFHYRHYLTYIHYLTSIAKHGTCEWKNIMHHPCTVITPWPLTHFWLNCINHVPLISDLMWVCLEKVNYLNSLQIFLLSQPNIDTKVVMLIFSNVLIGVDLKCESPAEPCGMPCMIWVSVAECLWSSGAFPLLTRLLLGNVKCAIPRTIVTVAVPGLFVISCCWVILPSPCDPIGLTVLIVNACVHISDLLFPSSICLVGNLQENDGLG